MCLWPVALPSDCSASRRGRPSQTAASRCTGGHGRGEGPCQLRTPFPPSLAEPPHSPRLQDSLVCLRHCPQVSEGPVLVVRPAGGLHFPAAEALREAIASRALEGTWARAGVAADPPHPACSCGTPRPCPPPSGQSSPLGSGRSGCLGGVSRGQVCPLLPVSAPCPREARAAAPLHSPLRTPSSFRKERASPPTEGDSRAVASGRLTPSHRAEGSDGLALLSPRAP